MSVAIPGWVFGTLFGILFGNIMPNSILNAFGIAIYAMFIAIIIPVARHKKSVFYVVAAAMLFSLAFYILPIMNQLSAGFRTIIITIVVAGVAAGLSPIKGEDTNEG
jgi:predicted branched-subunit amino acid permease